MADRVDGLAGTLYTLSLLILVVYLLFFELFHPFFAISNVLHLSLIVCLEIDLLISMICFSEDLRCLTISLSLT